MTEKPPAISSCCRILQLTLSLALGVALAACSSRDPRGRIVGKVTFQGHAVSEGYVVFSNNDKGVHMTAELKPDGTYEMTMPKLGGLPVGTYQIRVRPPDPPLPPFGSTAIPKVKECPDIPHRYREDATSGLTATVKQGENSFDIAMKP